MCSTSVGQARSSGATLSLSEVTDASFVSLFPLLSGWAQQCRGGKTNKVTIALKQAEAPIALGPGTRGTSFQEEGLELSPDSEHETGNKGGEEEGACAQVSRCVSPGVWDVHGVSTEWLSRGQLAVSRDRTSQAGLMCCLRAPTRCQAGSDPQETCPEAC